MSQRCHDTSRICFALLPPFLIFAPKTTSTTQILGQCDGASTMPHLSLVIQGHSPKQSPVLSSPEVPRFNACFRKTEQPPWYRPDTLPIRGEARRRAAPGRPWDPCSSLVGTAFRRNSAVPGGGSDPMPLQGHKGAEPDFRDKFCHLPASCALLSALSICRSTPKSSGHRVSSAVFPRPAGYFAAETGR